jgi:hypothetical protein
VGKLVELAIFFPTRADVTGVIATVHKTNRMVALGNAGSISYDSHNLPNFPASR